MQGSGMIMPGSVTIYIFERRNQSPELALFENDFPGATQTILRIILHL